MMGTKGIEIQKLETRNVRVFIASLDLPTFKLKTQFIYTIMLSTAFSRPRYALRRRGFKARL